MAIVFSSLSSTTVRENLYANSVLYTVIANDPDTAGTLSYALSGSDAALLSIDSVTGEVRVKDGTDYENISSYTFTVTVSNTVNDVVVTTNNIDVTVSVSDAIEGTTDDDSYTANLGDVYDGLNGNDTVIIAGNKSDYSFAKTGNNELTISDVSGEQIVLRNIDLVQFDDESLTINTVNTSYTDEFRINSVTDNSQQNPIVTSLVNGNFLVAWQSYENSSWEIKAQEFSPNGIKVSDEFTLNTTTESHQYHFNLVGLSSGGYAAFYRNESDYGMYLKIVNADNTEILAETKIKNGGSNLDNNAITQLTSGNIVVVYENNSDIDLQIFDSMGESLNTLEKINTTIDDSQANPTITALNDGGFVVSWITHDQDGSGWGVAFQRFDGDGVPAGIETIANTSTSGSQEQVTSIALADGGFALAWYNSIGNNIHYQRFDSDGIKVGTEKQINASNTNTSNDPQLSLMSDGNIFVSWTSWYDYSQDDSLGITGNYIDIDGNRLGTEFTVNDDQNNEQRSSSLAINDNGDIFITWQSYDPNSQNFNNEIRGKVLQPTIQIIDNGVVIGGPNDDQLTGTNQDDVLLGGAGDDTIDGGAGLNTYRVMGTPDSFSWRENDDGSFKLVDYVTEPGDDNYTDEGTDTLRNIHIIEFVSLEDGSVIEVELDDYENVSSENTTELGYGIPIKGSIDFNGDKDYFQLAIKEGVEVQASVTGNNVYIDWNGADITNPTADDIVNLNVAGGSSSSSNYTLTLRRVYTGTDDADQLIMQDQFEIANTGDGDDVITGSSFDDQINTEAGNDTITASQGTDSIDGGDGLENKVVFTGNQTDYTINWTGQNQLTVTDKVDGRDGINTLTNIQILQFADTTITLDSEANSPSNKSFGIGEQITGTAPVANNSITSDIDYFVQLFEKTKVGDDTAIRINFSIDAPEGANGEMTFYLVNQDGKRLYFDSEINADMSGGYYESYNGVFRAYPNQVVSFLVTPTVFKEYSHSEGEEFLSDWHRLDLRVENRIYLDDAEITDTVTYKIKFDLVLLGEDNVDDEITAEDIPADVGYIDVKGGNDIVEGTDNPEEIIGGYGDDTLAGNGGDDIIRDIYGNNTLSGGAGDDIFNLVGGSSPQGSISGGEGTDTLIINGSSNLSGLDIDSVEVLDGNGATISADIKTYTDAGFTSIQNVTFRINPSVSNGTLDISGLAGSVSLRGTSASDTLIGNDQNNIIYLGTDQDPWFGEQNGIDTVVAGAGDDEIRAINGYSWHHFFSSVEQATKTYQIQGYFDGGDGQDTFVIDFRYQNFHHAWGGQTGNSDAPSWDLDLSSAVFTNIENLRVLSSTDSNRPHLSPDEIGLTIEQINSITSFEGVNRVFIKGGGVIDVTTLNDKGIMSWRLGDNEDYQITGSENGDSIVLQSGNYTLDTGAGNDSITLQGRDVINDVLTAGEGNDSLRIKGDVVDLSGATLTGFESMRIDADTLVMTSIQWSQFNDAITRGTGYDTKFVLALTTSSEDEVVLSDDFFGLSGTADDDILTGNDNDNVLLGGDGADQLSGLAGDDVIQAGAGDDIVLAGLGNDTIKTGTGTDTVDAGDGDDSIDISGKQIVLDNIDGGAGTDTLVVEDGQDLTGATLSNIEALSGNGTVKINIDQFSQLLSISGVKIELVYPGSASDYTISKSADEVITITDNNDVLNDLVISSSISEISFSDGGSVSFTKNFAQSGSEISVNTLADKQHQNPKVIALDNGHYAITYAVNGHNDDVDGWDVYVQLLNQQGEKVGEEILVNTTTSNSQYYPDIAATQNGGFAVTWWSNSDAARGIYTKLFDSDGEAISAELRANQEDYSHEWSKIDVLENGNIVVVWQNSQIDNNDWGIAGRIYDADGGVISNTFQVNTTSERNQNSPNVTSLADGGFVVVWRHEDWESDERELMLQRYDADGNRVGLEVQVSQLPTNAHYADGEPSVIGLDNGGYAVAWSMYNVDNYGSAVIIQFFDADGNRVGGNQIANTNSYNDQQHPELALVPGGDVQVVWSTRHQYNSPDDFGIYTRTFNQDGVPISGTESLVNTITDNTQTEPALVFGDDSGLFVWLSNTEYSYDLDGVTYQSSFNQVKAQVYDASTQIAIGNDIYGGAGDDVLNGAAGPQTIEGGLGDDVVDGGTGINTYVTYGSEDAFALTVDPNGNLKIVDLIVDPNDSVNGSDQGADILRNIQVIRYISDDGETIKDVQVDDFGNGPDSTNTEVIFGQSNSGKTNFFGDVDSYNFSAVAGQSVVISGIEGSSNGTLTTSTGESIYIGSGSERTIEFSQTGNVTFSFTSNEINSNNPSSSRNYGFVVRRIFDGSEIAETIEAGTDFEQINAGGGDDIILGSTRDDKLLGQDGNDVITGAEGNDIIDGGAGFANVATFSGTSDEYAISWNENNGNLSIRVVDSVAERDETDILQNIQILEFADGEQIVIDAESNAPVSSGGVQLGEEFDGSIPFVNQHIEDTDYTQLILPASVTNETALLITISVDKSQLPNDFDGHLNLEFHQAGRWNRLNFNLVEQGYVTSNFGWDRWGNNNSWLVQPTSYENGVEFSGGLSSQRLDVKVTGRAQDNSSFNFGDLLEYSIQVDLVTLGTEEGEDVVGTENSTTIMLLGGDDTYTGTNADQTVFGGLGNDSITTGSGNDVVIDSDGINTIQTGAGDDIVDFSGSSFLQGTIDGGEGIDTVILNGNADLSNLEIINVEIFDGNNQEVTANIDNFSEFTTIQNITFRLASSTRNGELDVSDFSGDINLRGTSGSDTFIGNDQNNIIYLNDNNDPGQGAQYGEDTVVANAGDDEIHVFSGGWDWQHIFTEVDVATRTYILKGSFDGGEGQDSFILDFRHQGFHHAWGEYSGNEGASRWSIDLSQADFTAIETLSVLTSQDSNRPNLSPSEIGLTIEQTRGLQSIEGVQRIALTGGGVVDLLELQTKGIISWRIVDDNDYTLVGTDQIQSIVLDNGNFSDISLLGGNDSLTFRNASIVSSEINGGEGNDLIKFTGDYVDISNANLINIEAIEVSSNYFAMTEAQWLEFGDNVSLTSGATTEFVIAFDEATSFTITDELNFVGVKGSDFDDTLIGNSLDNIIIGSGGNDLLIGNAGNDRLEAGSGTNRLLAGTGDDLLVIDKDNSSDELSGGEGQDTLLIKQDTNLTAASLSGIEIIKGNANVIMSLAQLSSVQVLDGVSVQLIGEQSSFIIPTNLTLINNASVKLPNADSNIEQSSGFIGSASDDVILGSSNDDTIFGGRGSDIISGGQGDDVIFGGSGANQLSGDDGADQIYLNIESVNGQIIDGGLGDDSLVIDFNNQHSSVNFSNSLISNVETLSLQNFNRSSDIRFNADLVESVSSIVNDYNMQNEGYWQASSLRIVGEQGQDISFDNFANNNYRNLYLEGDFGTVNYSNNLHQDLFYVNDQDPNFADQFYVEINSFTDFIGSEFGDVLRTSDTQFNVQFGAGDDALTFYGSVLYGEIDGGIGIDQVTVTGSGWTGFTDLSNTTFINIENIKHGENTLLLTSEQFAGLSLEGTGSIFIRDGDKIVGSSENDNFNGSILDTFEGAAGDDNVSNINTFVVSGNLADYDYTPGSSQITLQHSRGARTDGTDTLLNVLNIQFADTTRQLDDAPGTEYRWEQPHQYLGVNNSPLRSALVNIDYGKQVNIKKDYNGDNDLLTMSLVPNSPLSIEGSTPNGSGWLFRFFDAQSGQQIEFESLTQGYRYGEFYSWMGNNDKWLPVIYNNQTNTAEPYKGGEVVVQVIVEGDEHSAEDLVFTVNYSDDYAGSLDTLGVMDAQLGEVQGYIGEEGDHDWIRTELIAGTKYEFNLKGVSSDGGTLADPKLTLRDAEGRVIENGIDVDTTSVGTDDKIIFRPTETGTFYLDVADVAGSNEGSWTLTQDSLDTIAGNISTTERIEWTSGNTFRIESEINALSDHDWFKVWLDKGLTYSFSLDGTSLGGTLSDPQLSLRSVTGRLLTQDDNGGTGNDAKLVFSASDSGWYYLDAGASGNAYKGTYIIQGASIQDDYVNTALTEGSVIVDADEPTTGLVTYIGDKDWFKAGLSAGVTYVISIKGDISDDVQLDPLIDPILFIRNADGDVIMRSDDADGLDVLAYFTPTQDGLYYFDVGSAFRYDIGAYQIDVSLAPPDDHASVLDDTATQITLNGTDKVTTSGDIGIPGDKDVFKVTLTDDKVYLIEGKGFASNAGTLIDPYIRVFDEAGFLVDFNNNGGKGNDAQFYFVPEEAGTYYIELSANNNANRGTYNLSISERNIPADDVPNNIATNIELSAGDVFDGNLLTQGDEDWFRVSLDANESYVFQLKALASGYGTLVDPFIEIRDASGTLIKAVDNMLISNEPSLQYTPTASGDFYIVVKANSTQDTGSYTLITRAPDDYGNTLQTATAIDMDETLVGGIQYNEGGFGVRAIDSIGRATDSDKDWFSFSVTEGEVYTFSAQQNDGSTLSRPMVEITDTDGRIIAIGDGLETYNGLAAATFIASSSTTLYARVIDGAGATGNYQVNLTLGDASDEDADGPVALSFVNDGTTIQSETIGNIALAGDTDTYTVALTEGHEYRIETVSIRNGNIAPLPNAQLDMSFTPTGSNETQTLDTSAVVGVPSSFAQGYVAADSDGTLSIELSALEVTQTGQYQIRIVDLGVAAVDDAIDNVDEFDNDTGTILAINETATGKIGAEDDKDIFAVNLTSGNIYDFSVKSYYDGLGTLSQAELKLLDAEGNLVSVGNIDADTGRAEMSISVFDDGRYFLEITGTDLPGNIGTYTLDTRLRSVDDNTDDDYSSDTQSSAIVGPGKPLSGDIEVAGDHDWARVTLEAGNVYVIDALADGDGAGGTLSDATVRIFSADGTEIAIDDNSGAGLDARIQFTPSVSGEYYIDVGGRADATGTYTLRVRELYSGVADPLASSQWYLDLANIDELNGQITGAGVTVGVVDDGIDTAHPDLKENLDFSLAFDTQFDTQDGNHKNVIPPDFHGTPVAGIIAAVANNETGIVGAAQDAELVSTRVKWHWGHITQALGLQWQFDVSNNSWGAIAPFSDNFNSTQHTFDWVNIRKGVEQGREGLGTVFVFSAGNSAGLGDNTNYHNFQNAREVITVGSVNSLDQASGFSTPGASVLVAAYGENLVTTDRLGSAGINRGGDYTEFTGTSASAPLVSGIVALMLEANPDLGYRDIQKILAYSTRHPDAQNWKENGASDLNLGGLSFNDKSGFGVVDAYAAVQLALTWQDQSTAINEVSASDRQFGMLESIPDGDGTAFTMSFDIDSPIMVENVELGIDLSHQRMGDLIITLTSPNGTVSTLMDRPTVNDERPFGLSGQDSGVPTHLLWDFSSVQFWGEEATGTWTISVTDVRAEQTGTIKSLSLRVYGDRDDGNDTYIFTDEGFQNDTTATLEDDSGIDSINAAAVRLDAYIDLYDGVIAANSVTYGIADWSIIENVFSGKGADRLVGNEANNLLNAGAGNDVLEGGLGDDTLIGGTGSDTAVYAGHQDEYTVVWDATTETITVTDKKSSDSDEGTDTLTGIERIVFADGDISLSEQVGNNAPVANRTFFDSTIVVATSAGIDLQIPQDAFSDADESEVGQLEIAVSDAAGGELPEWLSYDAETNTFTGVPPEDYQGTLKIKVAASDEFGETAEDILTLQFGPDQGPVLDDPSELVLQEDAVITPLGFSTPEDPEGTAVTVTILGIPSFGKILDKNGAQVAVGATFTADEFTELNFQTEQNANGSAGFIRYSAADENGVTSESSLSIFVEAVNDAPSFTTDNSKLVINYPEQSEVTLDLQSPTDPESTLSTVTLIGLPEIGAVSLDGAPVTLNQVLTFDQLSRLSFTLSENVNGPIGGVTIQAVDPQGLATDWTLNLEVSGDAASDTGTPGADELYGSIGDDIIYGKAGDDLLVGNSGDDRLLAGLGNDTLLGGSGNDKLDGSAGNDYIDGGDGNDIMAGGPGNDIYIVDQTGDVVLEVIQGGAGGEDLVVTSFTMTAPTNIENLLAADGESINLTGNALDNTLLGNDEINTLAGGLGRDILFGEGGDDTLDGGKGIDRMVGGLGSDTYYVDSKADRVVELVGEGTDTVFAGSSYTLSSNIENLTLQGTGDFTAGGNSLDNHIIGNSGNNILAGGLGADTLEGGLGDDIYVLSDSLDVIIDTGGDDTIRSSQNVELQAGIENAQLVGIADTYVIGNGLDNTLQGNLGDNILDGGLGLDTLIGDEGADQFIISNNGDDVDSDIVQDFTSGEDLLVIDLASFGIDAEALGILSSGLVSTESFVFGAGAVALDNNDHFIYDSAQGILYFDEDGSGDAEMIELARVKTDDGSDALNASDIFVGI